MVLYNTDNTTRSYSLRKEFPVTQMSVKCRGSSLQIDSQHTLLDTSFLCVFMRRNDKHDSKADTQFHVIYSQLQLHVQTTLSTKPINVRSSVSAVFLVYKIGQIPVRCWKLKLSKVCSCMTVPACCCHNMPMSSAHFKTYSQLIIFIFYQSTKQSTKQVNQQTIEQVEIIEFEVIKSNRSIIPFTLECDNSRNCS